MNHDGYYFVQACLTTVKEMNKRLARSYRPSSFMVLIFYLNSIREQVTTLTGSARHLGVTLQRMTEMVKMCEQRGLIKRHICRDDARIYYMHLTRRGFDLIKAVDERTLAFKMGAERAAREAAAASARK